MQMTLVDFGSLPRLTRLRRCREWLEDMLEQLMAMEEAVGCLDGSLRCPTSIERTSLCVPWPHCAHVHAPQAGRHLFALPEHCDSLSDHYEHDDFPLEVIVQADSAQQPSSLTEALRLCQKQTHH